MKLKERFNKYAEELEVDSHIDRTNLVDECIKLPSLHNKYSIRLAKERLYLKTLEDDFSHLSLECYQYYLKQADMSVYQRKGQFNRNILKGEVDRYMQDDKELQELSTTIVLCKEIIRLLEGAIKEINARQFNIKNIIEMTKMENGIT